MTIYADYEYYTDDFFGTILTEENFSSYALKASSYINYVTMNRAKKHPEMEEVKFACCALAEQYQVIDTAKKLSSSALSAGVSSLSENSAEIQSQTVGGWSRSLRSGGDSSQSALAAIKAAEEQLDNIALHYLGSTGLMRARGYYA